jgi:hypothetical protein
LSAFKFVPKSLCRSTTLKLVALRAI